MHIFYTPDITGKNYFLDENESKHCLRVLRLKKGDEINLVDGIGGFYTAQIAGDNLKSCELEIKKVLHDFEKRSYHFHLAIAPTKNPDRLEWLVEKAVEIGIDEFTPVICEHSERKKLNIDRLERIAVAAMKQSVKAYKPLINEATSFKSLISRADSQIKLIAHCEELSGKTINKFYQDGKSVVCLIGPEGDFSKNEIDAAAKAGFEGITLGKSRLRTETAGLVVCHTIYFLNQL
jgi:16S rRNA (uracil1498-N3)-methyltransferase